MRWIGEPVMMSTSPVDEECLVTGAPELYERCIRHTQIPPIARLFDHRFYVWLVDLDTLPEWPVHSPVLLQPFVRFEARDHLVDPARTIRQKLDAWHTGHGVEPPGGQVLMLTHARQLGHVSNPVSLDWCHRPDGALGGVVAEAHNTYGQRHCHLLNPDTGSRSGIAKTFHVSPFLTVEGNKMQVRCPGPRLAISVTLRQPGATVFSASLVGVRRSATPAALVRLLARLMTHRVPGLIRRHGMGLWLRLQPMIPRPTSSPREGLQ